MNTDNATNQIGLEKADMSEVIAQLNNLLSTYHVFYLNVRGYHWNVKGEHFFTLHPKFEELYTALQIQIDEIAERILTLGGTPLHAYSDFVQQNNTVIASQQGIAGNRGGLFSGIGKALGGVFGGAGDAELQNQRAIASLDQPAAMPQSNVNTGTTNIKQTTSVNTTTNTLDAFMQVWLQATPAEREKMRQWIQQ